jgi:osmotically-inducible protein OsmY
MARAALLSLRTGKHTDQEEDALEQPASPPTESPEDLHLARQVERALHATGYGAVRNIEVTVQARVVTLAGRVSSYYLKQVAQTAALGVPGILRIRNELEVV